MPRDRFTGPHPVAWWGSFMPVTCPACSSPSSTGTVRWSAMLRYLRPDIVKLRFASGELLSAHISAVHAVGGTALVTHLETDEEVFAALKAGADWRQGYALGYPAGLEVTPLAVVP